MRFGLTQELGRDLWFASLVLQTEEAHVPAQVPLPEEGVHSVHQVM